ncbi:MAG: hypothetical protein ACO1SV_03270 [Fimbriimonas sp.]
MKRPFRLIALSALAMTFASASAQQSLVRLSAFPTISVADSRSTTTISAEIRDTAGRNVPDGTRVVFNTTIGTFRESVSTTINGVARAILVADGRTGIAKITASPLSGSASPATLDFEFVADRAMLSTAKEYIEFVAPGLMHYTSDTRLIGASGANHGVSLRYRDITIEADDLQFNIPTYELRARKAKLRMGKLVQEFDALYLRLNLRRGYGLTTYTARRPKFPVAVGHGLAFGYLDAEGKINVGEAPAEPRFGLVEVKGPAIAPTTQTPPGDAFEMADLSFATSRVSAKKAVVFPNRQIQFHRAEVFVADSRVMKLPLFQVNLLNNTTPLVTENLVNVTDNNVALNYPHYLSLKPGQTSLLRFRTGDMYGRGISTSRGASLDYEMNWNRGDEMDGGFVFRGIGRSDWGVGIRQFNRFDSKTSGSLQLDMPSGRGIFGNGNLNRDFDGFQVSLNGTADQSFRGIKRSYRSLNFSAETDPIKMGKTPFRAFYGLTAANTVQQVDGQASQGQQSAGVRARLQSLPVTLDSRTTVTTGFSVSGVTGRSVGDGLQLNGNTTLSHRLSANASFLLSYDYARDGYNDQILGMHRISLQSYMTTGRTGLRIFHSRSLDRDRQNLFADLEYRPSKTWVLRSSYTYDHYSDLTGSNSFLDGTLSLGYVVGWREIGLVYSRRTRRIGIQLLGAGGY